MNPHAWFVEQRTAFVVRALEPGEERAFHEHLAGCAECREAVEALERDVSWLPMGLPPAASRPGLNRQLVAGVLGERGAAPRWWAPAALAASLILAAGAWFWALTTTRAFEAQLAGERARLAEELAMVRDTLGIIRDAAVVRHARIAMDGREGGLLIFADERTHRWNVVVYGLPAPPAGETCQFWFITESGMVRSVAVPSDGRTPAFLTLPMPPDARHVMGAALTMEPAGSSGGAPAGVQLAHLML